MKKFPISIFTLLLFSFIATSTSYANETLDVKDLSTGKVKVTVTNNETGETKVLDSIKPTKYLEKTNLLRTLGNESVIEGYEIFIPMETGEINITPFDSSGGTRTGGGITAALYVDYSLRSANQEIRLNKLWGSWTPSSNLYYLTDREASAHSGAVWGNSIYKYPTSNTFSYNTGFVDYNYFVLGGDGAPRAWSSAISRLSGMIATYTITVEFTYPD
ncbi:hypothetical protein A0U40_16120 [[Bacillus] sp. KCTC 13219]|nr:hypothetical protein A0U40_16120 [[Bacillus] sp. KCTC 13219]